MADDEATKRHLRDHLVDGCFHDDCLYCVVRRVKSGTGVVLAEPVIPGSET